MSVVRDGKVLVVKSGDLVPGDCVQLPKEGENFFLSSSFSS